MPSVFSSPPSVTPASLNFSGKSLRGRNFNGQDLSGADFSGADIRGANFTNAILQGANFSGAKAGAQRRWVVGQFVGVFTVSSMVFGMFVFFAVQSVALTVWLWSLDGIRPFKIFYGLVCLLVSVREIYIVSSRYFTPKVAGTIAVIHSLTCGMFFLFAFMVLGWIAFGLAIAASETGAITVAGVATGALVGIAVGAFVSVGAASTMGLAIGAFAGMSVFAIALFGIYVAWCNLSSYEKSALVHMEPILTFIGGTSFKGANLTRANFTKAQLKSANFNRSKQQSTCLTHVCWKNAQKLDFARTGTSNLWHRSVRQLLTTCNGINQSYLGIDLSHANLNGVQLNGAKLKGVNLSGATLQGADLQYANLTETLAIGADFTGAYLTGACLESWNIDSTTRLQNVDCQFVFLREQPDANGSRDRRPHDAEQVFAEGDFEKLLSSIKLTVVVSP